MTRTRPPFSDDLVHFGQQIVDLPLGGLDRDGRIEQPRRADELFDDLPRLFQLVGRGRRGDADHLRHARIELLKRERTVVIGGLHAEAVLHKIDLACKVAVVHGADLRNGHVALVDEYEEIFGKIVEQGKGWLPGRTAVEIAGIVFHARTVADLAEHFKVVFGTLAQPLCFEQFARVLKRLHFPLQILFDHGERRDELFRPHRIVTGREDDGVFERGNDLARHDVHFAEAVDLVAEKFDADGDLRIGRGKDLHHVAAHAEGRTLEIHVVARILNADQPGEQFVARHLLSRGAGKCRGGRTPPARPGRRCRRRTRRRSRRRARPANRSPRCAVYRSRRSWRNPFRYRYPSREYSSRADNSRNRRRNIPRGFRGKIRGIRCTAARQASCCAR